MSRAIVVDMIQTKRIKVGVEPASGAGHSAVRVVVNRGSFKLESVFCFCFVVAFAVVDDPVAIKLAASLENAGLLPIAFAGLAMSLCSLEYLFHMILDR